MLILQHGLAACFISSPCEARLAADGLRRAASLPPYRGSCSRVAVLTQPQQIGVPYKAGTLSALPKPPSSASAGRQGEGPERRLFHTKESDVTSIFSAHKQPPRPGTVSASHTRQHPRGATKQKPQETPLNLGFSLSLPFQISARRPHFSSLRRRSFVTTGSEDEVQR